MPKRVAGVIPASTKERVLAHILSAFFQSFGTHALLQNINTCPLSGSSCSLLRISVARCSHPQVVPCCQARPAPLPICEAVFLAVLQLCSRCEDLRRRTNLDGDPPPRQERTARFAREFASLGDTERRSFYRTSSS